MISVDMPPRSNHAAHCEIARRLYIESRVAHDDSEDWSRALRTSRQILVAALRASNYLTNIAGALQSDGAHMLAFRHLLAPPLSQDQFRLLCQVWNKGSEKHVGSTKGTSRISLDAALAASKIVDSRRSRTLTQWIDQNRPPMRREIQRLLWSVAPLIASQQVATLQRSRASSNQEQSVITLLNQNGWLRLPSKLLDTKAALPLKHFMHKTRFATATTAPQEVDIALGLKNTVVLAMECKVTNDETNSVKRINDVLKKASAWTQHWGSFVKTAALLQGVINPKDVKRLVDAQVEVFWSHDLAAFETWINSEISLPIKTQRSSDPKGLPINRL